MIELNNSEKFGLSISGENSHLIQFKKREIQDKNVVHLKEKIRSELFSEWPLFFQLHPDIAQEPVFSNSNYFDLLERVNRL